MCYETERTIKLYSTVQYTFRWRIPCVVGARPISAERIAASDWQHNSCSCTCVAVDIEHAIQIRIKGALWCGHSSTATNPRPLPTPSIHTMETHTVQMRAATTLRSLKRQARELAEHDATTTQVPKSLRKKAVRSAFVSRQTGRHYARLLAQHVVKLERERDETVQSIHETAADVTALRQWLSLYSSPTPSILDQVIEAKPPTQQQRHEESMIWAAHWRRSHSKSIAWNARKE